jgi:hypothetical protein
MAVGLLDPWENLAVTARHWFLDAALFKGDRH